MRIAAGIFPILSIAASKSIVLDLRTNQGDTINLNLKDYCSIPQAQSNLELQVQNLIAKEHEAKNQAENYHQQHVALKRKIQTMINPHYSHCHKDNAPISHYGQEYQSINDFKL